MAKYTYELTLSSSPHAHSPVGTETIMRDVLLALLPALVGAVCFFGPRALVVTAVSTAACVAMEWAYRRWMKLDNTVWDLSAAVTGVLIAFVSPPTIPYWVLLLGDAFAILLVKQLFGGIGQNFVNPALAGRAFMMSWAVHMTSWVPTGFSHGLALGGTVDAVTAATPLAAMHTGDLPHVTLGQLFLGQVGGCIGETSALLLLLGFGYLLVRRVISPRIPLSYLGTVAVLAFLFPRGNDPLLWSAMQLCSGGLMLGAIFMATDYVTSPVTKLGQVLFGMGCGVLTLVIRYFGGYPEGVSYAILMMNCCAPLLDRLGRPRVYGTPGRRAKA